jgi:Fe2+ or Zn2+ uptake regulation protein
MDNWEQLLAEAGHRITASRRAVMQALAVKRQLDMDINDN